MSQENKEEVKLKWHEFEQRKHEVKYQWGVGSAQNISKITDEQDRADRLWQAMVASMVALITNPNQSKYEPWLKDQEATASCAKHCAEALLAEWEKEK